MLIRVTNKCTMQCVHCMIDAHPAGEHMSWAVFKKAVNFVQNCGPPHVLLLGGGEPSEHPDLMKFIQHAKRSFFDVLLLSNGEFLWLKPELRDRILPVVYAVQVTNDVRFYSRKVEEYKHPKVCYIDKLGMLSPHGRAVSNKLETNRRSPECFNMRSMARFGASFEAARRTLVERGKFCTPSINVDGSISAGESSSCSKVGAVYDKPDAVMEKLGKLKCQKCGLVNSLTAPERAAIGE